MNVAPKVFGDKPPSPEQMKNCNNEIFKNCLPRLDRNLTGKKFFCGENVTMADFHHFNEISNVLNLTGKELVASEYPNLAPWYNERMAGIPEVLNLESKLASTLQKYGLN